MPDINFTIYSLYNRNKLKYRYRSASEPYSPFFIHWRFHFYLKLICSIILLCKSCNYIAFNQRKAKKKYKKNHAKRRIGMHAHALSTRPPDSCDFLLIFDAIRIKKEFHKICECYVLALARQKKRI